MWVCFWFERTNHRNRNGFGWRAAPSRACTWWWSWWPSCGRRWNRTSTKRSRRSWNNLGSSWPPSGTAPRIQHLINQSGRFILADGMIHGRFDIWGWSRLPTRLPMRPCHGRKKKDWIYSEIVRQLRSTGVTGIHGDADEAHGVEAKLGAFEEEGLLVRLDGAENAQHLLRHHRQHLGLDAVELVEAGPRSRWSKSPEELSKRKQDGFNLGVKRMALVFYELQSAILLPKEEVGGLWVDCMQWLRSIQRETETVWK